MKDKKIEKAKARHNAVKGLSESLNKEIEILDPPNKDRSVSVFWILQAILVSLICLLCFSVYFIFSSIANDKLTTKEISYELGANKGVSNVVRHFYEDKYPSYMISLWVYFNHKDYDGLQKGTYAIDKNTSLRDLLEKMQRGDVIEIKPMMLTLSDGMQYDLIKKRIQKTKGIINDLDSIKDIKAFIKNTLKTQDLIDAIGGVHDNLEGLLLPASYPYFKDTKASDIIKSALEDMAYNMSLLWHERNQDILVKTPYEALILASLVERESAIKDEMPMIASAFYNRLKISMRLQTDPAVMYGISPLFRGPLKVSQLKKDSPYNTYTRVGLPPTPIAMPSINAIKAVLHPAKSDVKYFVAKSYDPKDGHVFSNTLTEHNKAVLSYKKKVREYINNKKKEQKHER